MGHKRDAQYLTTSQIARLWGCTPENIRRLTRLGQLVPSAVIGRAPHQTRLFTRAHVDAVRDARAQARVPRPVAPCV